MPEFPGYLGKAQPAAAGDPRDRDHAPHAADLQTIIGPGEEHTNLTGIPTEASMLRLVENTMPGRLVNVYCTPPAAGSTLPSCNFATLRNPTKDASARPR